MYTEATYRFRAHQRQAEEKDGGRAPMDLGLDNPYYWGLRPLSQGDQRYAVAALGDNPR